MNIALRNIGHMTSLSTRQNIVARSNLIIGSALQSTTSVAATTTTTPTWQQYRNMTVVGHSYFKKQSKEYHRNSTQYAVSDRTALAKMEKEFVMPPRHEPRGISDNFARFAVWSLRKLSNLFFKEKYIHYACVLETVAAVPGMVAGMLQHLKTLRNMEHNNWIKVLLDEAENERMHLMTFMEISMPTKWERVGIASVQAIYWNCFLVFYLLSPRTAHRFTGYLEEEAVLTYTNMLRDLDDGKVKNVEAPKIAIDYWGLPEDAKLRDVIMVIRQDECDHRDVNHTISDHIRSHNEDNAIVIPSEVHPQETKKSHAVSSHEHKEKDN
ncbi:hypothetical protein SAMD00019534_035230, partial [Acytostelium subglobosum LB1]|uniref:hypothetical protein n=1 Tax=Acytostelium subglobosum LB1 TaxID=1410327 RepID=UPI000644EB1D